MSAPTSPSLLTPTETDLLTLAQTDPFQPLSPSNSLLLATALTQPPFILLPSTFNTRDLGLLPASPLRPGWLFRSGGFLSGLSPEGKTALVDGLGIKKVFDLRSAGERGKMPSLEVEGVETVWVAPEGASVAVRLENFVEGEGEKGFVRMYLGVLRIFGGAVRALLKEVRDGEGGGVLFHCTAGRDRTGVVAGLLLSLAGARPETVALDFVLSQIGTAPVSEQLLAVLLKGFGAASIDVPGVANLCRLRVGCWEAFVAAVESEYGGFEGYVTGALGFSEADLAKIKSNLVRQN